MKESTYLQATLGKPVTHTPIWIMRQAGRYMRSFRELRQRHSFMEIVKTPALAAEVTLQPIKAFDFDAAIIFSDILVVADALGCPLEYQDQTGPVIRDRIMEASDIRRLQVEGIEERLSYVTQAIRLGKQELSARGIPLIGFAGAPFTLASYMIGDGERHDMKKFLLFYFRHPELVEKVLDVISEATVRYLNAQIEAGVDAIQIFDSWTNELPWSLAERLSAKYLKEIIGGLKKPDTLPVTVFGTGNSVFYPLLTDTGAKVIAFDSKVDLAHVRKRIPESLAVQGNLDAHFLLAPRNVLKAEAEKLLDSMHPYRGFIFNLGHGIKPETPEDNVRFLIDLVHSYIPTNFPHEEKNENSFIQTNIHTNPATAGSLKSTPRN